MRKEKEIINQLHQWAENHEQIRAMILIGFLAKKIRNLFKFYGLCEQKFAYYAVIGNCGFLTGGQKYLNSR